jgi:endonuclease/exonuclease/phosphatase family metal-dependent hydrolase
MGKPACSLIMRLSLATYNIHSCIGGDGRYDPGRILGVLKELDVDIIALQEVDSREHQGLELMHWLAKETGLQAIAGPTLLRQTGKYGNALLLRCEALKVRRIDLTVLRHEPRGAIDVDVSCGGHILQLIATHLGLRPAERREQVQRVLESFGTKHCVLMGDLNEWFLWGRPLRWIQAMFGRARHLATFPARCPILALDRIWVRPPGTVTQLMVHRTVLARQASDHLPLRAVLEL